MSDDYEFDEHDMAAGMRACAPFLLREFVGQPIRLLEIGVYDARNATWLLDNVLTHQNSRYVGVDAVVGHEAAHERAIKNLERHAGKVTLIAGDSADVLPALFWQGDEFDVVYVDGCHSAAAVSRDAVNGWELLRSGGVMIFDDYDRDDYGVRQSVDEFLTREPSAVVVYRDYKVAVRKS